MSIPPPFIRPRVLVVDDSRTVRESVLQQLRDRFDVSLEDDGEAAWDALQRDPSIRAVVADLSMPRLDGYGLLERMRSSREARIRNTPVIIMSVNDGDTEYAAAKALGAIGFVSKSRVRAVLAARLDSLLSMAPGTRLTDTQSMSIRSPGDVPPAGAAGGRPPGSALGAEDTYTGLRPPFALPRGPNLSDVPRGQDFEGPPTVPLHALEPLELSEVVTDRSAASGAPVAGTQWIDFVLDDDIPDAVTARADQRDAAAAARVEPTTSATVTLPLPGQPGAAVSGPAGSLTAFGRFMPAAVGPGQAVMHFSALEALDDVRDARVDAGASTGEISTCAAAVPAAEPAPDAPVDAPAATGSGATAEPQWPPLAASSRGAEFSVVRAANLMPWGNAAARGGDDAAPAAAAATPQEMATPPLQGESQETQHTPSKSDDTAPPARVTLPIAAREQPGQENSMSRFETLNKVLKNLQTESPGVQASALISEDGLMIASVLAQDMDETRVAGMTATLLNLGTRAATELRRGDVKEVIVRGEQGYAVMINAGRGALLLVLASESTPLGLIFFDMREAIKAIKTIL